MSVTFEYLSLSFERLAPLDEIQYKLKLTSHSYFQLGRVNAQTATKKLQIYVRRTKTINLSCGSFLYRRNKIKKKKKKKHE